MAYDAELAERIRSVVGVQPHLSEMRMFGGLAFLVNGNLAVAAVSRGGLMVRVDPADTGSLVTEAHVQRFQMRGRQMDGWLLVGSEAVAGAAGLRRWVEQGIGYARSLPAKGARASDD